MAHAVASITTKRVDRMLISSCRRRRCQAKLPSLCLHIFALPISRPQFAYPRRHIPRQSTCVSFHSIVDRWFFSRPAIPTTIATPKKHLIARIIRVHQNIDERFGKKQKLFVEFCQDLMNLFLMNLKIKVTQKKGTTRCPSRSES